MSKRVLVILALIVLLGAFVVWRISPPAADKPEPTASSDSRDHEEHSHKEGEKEEHDEKADRTTIAAAAAQAAGIAVVEAGPAIVTERITLNGKIMLNQNRTAAVRARFPGVVRSVEKVQGDTVQIGDVLAKVESNDSLQVYAVKAPLAGIVLSRATNVGDTAADAPIFTIADMRELWAELHLFPQDLAKMQLGASVQLLLADCTPDRKNCRPPEETAVFAILPVAEGSTQTTIVRVRVDNSSGVWSPGMAVRGDVVVASQQVAIAVPAIALQRVENKTVVFVQEGEDYLARPVKVGREDGKQAEIIEGLAAGEKIVSEGSFAVKADIGKAGAEHEH